MVRKKPLHALLRKRESSTDILLQTLLERLTRLLQERLLGRVLDTVHSDLRLESREALVGLDIPERLLYRLFRCV